MPCMDERYDVNDGLAWMDDPLLSGSLNDIDPNSLSFSCTDLPTPSIPLDANMLSSSLPIDFLQRGLFSPEMGSIKPLFAQSPSILRKRSYNELASPLSPGAKQPRYAAPFSPTSFFRSPQAVKKRSTPLPPQRQGGLSPFASPGLGDLIAEWSSPRSTIQSLFKM